MCKSLNWWAGARARTHTHMKRFSPQDAGEALLWGCGCQGRVVGRAGVLLAREMGWCSLVHVVVPFGFSFPKDFHSLVFS